MNIDLAKLADFLLIGMLWTATTVCLLWICQQIVAPAATRMLIAVICVLAACNAIKLYLWIQSFQSHGSHTLLYWLQVALHILMICLIIPKLRNAMWIITLIILPSFVVFVTPHWLNMK